MGPNALFRIKEGLVCSAPAWAILFAIFMPPLVLCHVRRPVSWRVSRRSYLEPLSGLDVLWGPFLRWRLHEEQPWSGAAAHAGL